MCKGCLYIGNFFATNQRSSSAMISQQSHLLTFLFCCWSHTTMSLRIIGMKQMQYDMTPNSESICGCLWSPWMEDNFWWYYWFGCSLCCRLHLSLISWFWGGPVLNFHMKCILIFWNTLFCLEKLLSRAHSPFMFYDKLISNFDNTYANTQASVSRLPSLEGCSNKLLEVCNINATIYSR